MCSICIDETILPQWKQTLTNKVNKEPNIQAHIQKPIRAQPHYSTHCTTRYALSLLIWVSYEFYHQYGGASTLEVTHPLYQHIGWTPYFSMVIFMPQNQSSHLCIDDRIHMIPISMVPVQFWQCEDWIFIDENKNPVTAPPDLDWHHWYGYQ